MFEWHKKEKPFLGMAGMGGGVASRMFGGRAPSGAEVIPQNVATGGLVEVTGGLIRHVFLSPGTFQAGPDHPGSIAYLIIGGGGGGGGSHHGGGGGAGGVIWDPFHPISLGSPYSISVGEGGQGGKGGRNATGMNPGTGGNGAPSSAFGATGGGGGGGGASHSSGGDSHSGGSGGGSGGSGAPNYPGPVSGNTNGPGSAYGNIGGSNPAGGTPAYGAGGGGGAGGTGTPGNWSPPNRGGPGGAGRDFPDAFFIGDGGAGNPWAGFSPSEPNSRYFAGGGGGSAYSAGSYRGVGSDGGGGAGAGANASFPSLPEWPGLGMPGRNFWGCGGGGGERAGTGGGHGGNGVVIIAYTATPTQFCTTRTSNTKLIEATGGFISEHLNPDGISVDRVHMFSTFHKKDGSAKAEQIFTVVSGSGSAELLLVGGGGGGGGKGGGGGGGEVVYVPSMTLNPGPYSVRVGGGGHGAAPPGPENFMGPNTYKSFPGDSSTFGAAGATTWGAGGGGRGGTDYDPSYKLAPATNGYVGGSGGGVAGGGYSSGGPNTGGGQVSPNPFLNPGAIRYANAGGNRGPDNSSEGPTYVGGGGGGASSAGTRSGPFGGHGGDGIQIPSFDMYGTTSGNSVNGTTSKGYFGGGGGGGGDNSPTGTGGVGGGGFGASPTFGWGGAAASPNWNSSRNRGRSGLPGTGGGGGGGSNNPGENTGGDGGDGIVCIRYKYIQG